MKAIMFTKANTAELVEMEMPEPGPGEVRVRLVCDTISSGTERANLIGVPDSGVGIFGEAGSDKTTWPRQCGYSNAGIIDKLGPDLACPPPSDARGTVTESVRQKEFPPSNLRCSTFNLRPSTFNLSTSQPLNLSTASVLQQGQRVAMSWAKHQEYVCVPVEKVYPIPEGVSFSDAALAHIATFPMAAIRKCRLEIGESAIVMGQGVLGQLAVKLLKAAGAAPIIAADPIAAKREEALRLGADFALDPSAPDFAAQAKAICQSEYKKIFGRVEMSGPQVGIEVTGVGSALDSCLDAIAPFGRIALLGCTRNSNFTIDYYHKVHGRGVTLVGAHTACRNASESAPGWWTERDDALAFLRLVALKRIDLSGFVAENHPASECGEVYARLAKDGAFPVVQFDWSQI